MEIKFIPEAAKDYKSLDGSIKKLADEKLDDLEKNPKLGEPLGNKYNMDLTGYYKIYFNKKKHRIVYRITEEKCDIEIIEIWGIGKKDKMEVYKDVEKRITKRK
jgi:mRNA interferase RelE/StbE